MDIARAQVSFAVRSERIGDAEAIRAVHCDAFETSAEADIVERIRADPEAYVSELSLVAETEGGIVGHVILSNGVFSHARMAMLGPTGVRRDHQRHGIGSALMGEAIERTRSLGYVAILLIGHPEYYPRFGFVPASRFGLALPYDVPDEVAMALVLDAEAIRGVSGVVGYPAAFSQTS